MSFQKDAPSLGASFYYLLDIAQKYWYNYHIDKRKVFMKPIVYNRHYMKRTEVNETLEITPEMFNKMVQDYQISLEFKSLTNRPLLTFEQFYEYVIGNTEIDGFTYRSKEIDYYSGRDYYTDESYESWTEVGTICRGRDLISFVKKLIIDYGQVTESEGNSYKDDAFVEINIPTKQCKFF